MENLERDVTISPWPPFMASQAREIDVHRYQKKILSYLKGAHGYA